MSKEASTAADAEIVERKYTPAPDERQLTVRAVVAGCLVGSIVSCTNIYIGLKIGWAFGASIISAVLGFSFFAIINRTLSVLETNVCQTAGSAAGYMSSAAGLIAAIPAMQMLGHKFTWGTLTLWALAVAFLGVFFAVPLRRQMIEVENLRFPTGTATAETILAMFSEAKEALQKARVLLWAGLGAGVFTLIGHFVPEVGAPPLHKWFEIGILTTAVAWGFKLYLGPSLFGAGFLVGPRVSFSLALGAIVAWAVLGPYVQSVGWAPGKPMSYADGPRGWVLWPGVALMVSESLASLALSWKTFVRALTMTKHLGNANEGETNPQGIPNSWWMGGLAAGSVLTIVIAQMVFDIPWWMTLIAIALSSILSMVAARSVGETDINPIGGMGKVTQLVFGAVAPGQAGTNLMAAAITSGAASQAGDMLTDLKTGHLLGASPRKQFAAQLAGIGAGVIFAVPVYYVFTSAYEIGSDQIPAPAAMAWKAMAELLAKGFGALPPHATEAIIVASIVGALVPFLRRIEAIKPYVPSAIAMGIAFIVPAFYSLVIFYGTLVWIIWKKKNASNAEKLTYSLASGLIAGEGLMGIANAVLTILGI